MEDQRRQAAETEAAARRATDAQVLEGAERLIAAWNERQAKRMPMLFSPTIGAAIAAFIGFCGYAVRPVGPFRLLSYACSTATPTRPSASFRHCPAAHAGRTPHSPSCRSKMSIAVEMREASCLALQKVAKRCQRLHSVADSAILCGTPPVTTRRSAATNIRPSTH